MIKSVMEMITMEYNRDKAEIVFLRGKVDVPMKTWLFFNPYSGP